MRAEAIRRAARVARCAQEALGRSETKTFAYDTKTGSCYYSLYRARRRFFRLAQLQVSAHHAGHTNRDARSKAPDWESSDSKIKAFVMSHRFLYEISGRKRSKDIQSSLSAPRTKGGSTKIHSLAKANWIRSLGLDKKPQMSPQLVFRNLNRSGRRERGEGKKRGRSC